MTILFAGLMGFAMRALAIYLCAVLTGTAVRAQKDIFTQSFSTVPVAEFPGGTYKSSNVNNFPASTTMSGSLITLLPGGLREPHWHDPVEWAYVINGTCRATFVDQGATHPSESWDFKAGDIWYFPSNAGHAVLGLADGCTYVAVYNKGDFDEAVNARGISDWLSTAPPEIVAQALGTSEDSVVTQISPDTNGFMPRGNLQELTAGQSDAPLLTARASPLGKSGQIQNTKEVHRYTLSLGQIPETNNTGGWIKLADTTVFPVSQGLIGALVYAAPYSLRMMHWHFGADEWQFVLNGTYEVGVFQEPGSVTSQTLNTGDVGFVPRGSGHWIKNTSPDGGFMLLIFNNGTTFTNVDMPGWLGSFPASYTAAVLNVSEAFVASWEFGNGDGLVGDKRGTHTPLQNSGRELGAAGGPAPVSAAAAVVSG